MSESLPNITGETSFTGSNGFIKTGGKAEGVFARGTSYNTGASGAGGVANAIKFDASKDNTVFQVGAKVRPDSMSSAYLIKF